MHRVARERARFPAPRLGWGAQFLVLVAPAMPVLPKQWQKTRASPPPPTGLAGDARVWVARQTGDVFSNYR